MFLLFRKTFFSLSPKNTLPPSIFFCPSKLRSSQYTMNKVPFSLYTLVHILHSHKVRFTSLFASKWQIFYFKIFRLGDSLQVRMSLCLYYRLKKRIRNKDWYLKVMKTSDYNLKEITINCIMMSITLNLNWPFYEILNHCA